MAEQPASRTALITGANSGVGFELTKRLLSEGWDVIALIRSDFAADEPLIAQARAQGRLRVYHTELSNFTRLQSALEEIRSHEDRIDVLFNNAAAAVGSIQLSPQGREMHFEVNTIVPYIIMMELKPLLIRGALKTVINISSNALLLVRQFDLEKLAHPTQYKAITGPYGASKLGLSLWTQAAAEALAADGIEIRSVNPGGNKTKMTSSDHFPKLLLLIRHLFFSHPRVGAALIYDVAFGSWRGTSGVFVNNGKPTAIKFAPQGPAILAAVHAIYAQEFRSAQALIA